MSASSATNAVQAAVYAVLAGDATLVGMTDRIGDRVPDGNTRGKVVVISVVSEVADRRLSDTGGHARQLLVSVASHVEDSQGATGAKTVQAIHQRVVELLDDATLAVTGWAFVSCDFDNAVVQQDGAWRSVIADFSILVEDL